MTTTEILEGTIKLAGGGAATPERIRRNGKVGLRPKPFLNSIAVRNMRYEGESLVHYFELIKSLIGMILVVMIVIWFDAWHAKSKLQQWALSTGACITSAQRRYLRTGPFFVWRGSGRIVFRIAAKDNTGAARMGWVCFGGWLDRAPNQKIQVRWDS